MLSLSSEDEAALITTLIEELNNNLKRELDPAPDFSPSSMRAKKGPLLLVVGASHAGRTADALEDEGASVLRAIIPGWRVMKSKIPHMVDLMKERLGKVKGDCTVIYQLFDNSFHMAMTEQGGLIPAVWEPGPGGKYHLHGEAIFAPKELQYSTFNLVNLCWRLLNPTSGSWSACFHANCRAGAATRENMSPTFRTRTTRRYRRRPFWPVGAT